jgi:hypothetical protein
LLDRLLSKDFWKTDHQGKNWLPTTLQQTQREEGERRGVLGVRSKGNMMKYFTGMQENITMKPVKIA